VSFAGLEEYLKKMVKDLEVVAAASAAAISNRMLHPGAQ
jgi:hypothetical protein